MRILLAEDEAVMSKAICHYLTCHDCDVEAVYDGENALAYAASNHYGCIILDIMMPRMDGLTVLRRLRSMGNHTPVLLLSARSEIECRIDGLNAGADDYLCKPFAMVELLARIRVVMRRMDVYVPDIIHIGNISLDQTHHLLCGECDCVQLSKLEYKLMNLFMRNPSIAFSSEYLLEHIWGYDSKAQTDSVWVYISYLKKKLRTLQANVEICSKRGVGYSLEIRNV